MKSTYKLWDRLHRPYKNIDNNSNLPEPTQYIDITIDVLLEFANTYEKKFIDFLWKKAEEKYN